MYMDYVKTYNEAARLNDFKVFLPFNYFTNIELFLALSTESNLLSAVWQIAAFKDTLS